MARIQGCVPKMCWNNLREWQLRDFFILAIPEHMGSKYYELTHLSPFHETNDANQPPNKLKQRTNQPTHKPKIWPSKNCCARSFAWRWWSVAMLANGTFYHHYVLHFPWLCRIFRYSGLVTSSLLNRKLQGPHHPDAPQWSKRLTHLIVVAGQKIITLTDRTCSTLF